MALPRHLRLVRLCGSLALAVPTFASGLDPTERAIVRHVDAQMETTLALLQRSVDVRSATENFAGVRSAGDVYAEALKPLGFDTRWESVPAETRRAGHLVAVRPGTAPGLMLMGHLDTVLEGEPFRRDGDRAWGSGVSDMKGGNSILVGALRALHAAGVLEGRAVVVVLTGDEESTGLPHAVSRKALLEAAAGVRTALSFEGYVPGTAVVGRRGFSSWRLEVEAKQAHSSTIFHESTGAGAIFELARVLDGFRQTLRETHLTFNPSVVAGGTDVELGSAEVGGRAAGKTNVVPRRAIAEGDLRYISREQLERARGRMRTIAAASLPHAKSRLRFTDGMPGMAPTPLNQALLARLDAVSRALGTGPIVAHDPSQRGAGDISFLPDDVARLDGLGALGGNEHAPGEWIDLRELPASIKRAALLIHRLKD